MQLPIPPAMIKTALQRPREPEMKLVARATITATVKTTQMMMK